MGQGMGGTGDDLPQVHRLLRNPRIKDKPAVTIITGNSTITISMNDGTMQMREKINSARPIMPNGSRMPSTMPHITPNNAS